MSDKEVGITEHGDLEEIGEGVYWVHGSMRMGPGMRISRNMTVIKSGEELTVVNAVRLNSAGEARLEELGEVAHVVKIGFFHGIDDHYYLRRFGARYWALPGGTRDQDPNPHEILTTDHLPIPDAELFVFEETKQPEGALLIHRIRGILITCDAVQNWPDTSRCSIPAKLACHLIGFTKRPAQIGPPLAQTHDQGRRQGRRQSTPRLRTPGKPRV